MVAFLEAVDGRIPNFAGIKYTYESLYEYNQCRLYKDGKFDMLHGQDETILPCLAMGGAQGGIGGTTNYNGCNLVGIIDAWNAGDLEKARQLQNFSQEVINVICHYKTDRLGFGQESYTFPEYDRRGRGSYESRIGSYSLF